MRNLIYTFCFSLLSLVAISQTNIHTTNPLAGEIMKGNYNPSDYMPSMVINHPDDIVAKINAAVNPDSLKSYLFKMSSFETRNTGSDTISSTTGIGASRRWANQMFEKFSTQNENRLIPFYLQFDQDICGMGQHRNACALLPGLDISDPSIIIIEAHMDSRCEGVCDVECTAHGMEDNGSGTALVLELARVMSQFAFDHTIVFMATIGEEQGLYGANAFAQYCDNQDIMVKAVLNNDIVGGIVCGETASEPSCPGLNHIDSTQVRLFSSGGINSPHKQLSRFIKLEYQEELLDQVNVPMMLTIMSAEDRSGRGGDHIPFRQRGFTAMRFTSANEHGNANVADPDYHDRQHTTDDLLGVDTDGDFVLDSFFVDFNYLARNAVINGTAAGLAAIGPESPSFEGFKTSEQILIVIDDPLDYDHYRLFKRSSSNDFDTIYTIVGAVDSVWITRESGINIISVATVDENGIESLFSDEKFIFDNINSTGEMQEEEPLTKPIELFQNRPNPFDESTIIAFQVHQALNYQKAWLAITDLSGREIHRIPTEVKLGLNEVLYDHGYNASGTFAYSIILDGKVMDTRRMIFAN